MKNLIRRIYDSGLDEATRYIYSYDLQRKYQRLDELFEKLKKCLNSEDIQLLNDYAKAAEDVSSGERYQGFYVGMKLSARLMTELLADD